MNSLPLSLPLALLVFILSLGCAGPAQEVQGETPDGFVDEEPAVSESGLVLGFLCGSSLPMGRMPEPAAHFQALAEGDWESLVESCLQDDPVACDLLGNVADRSDPAFQRAMEPILYGGVDLPPGASTLRPAFLEASSEAYVAEVVHLNELGLTGDEQVRATFYEIDAHFQQCMRGIDGFGGDPDELVRLGETCRVPVARYSSFPALFDASPLAVAAKAKVAVIYFRLGATLGEETVASALGQTAVLDERGNAALREAREIADDCDCGGWGLALAEYWSVGGGECPAS